MPAFRRGLLRRVVPGLAHDGADRLRLHRLAPGRIGFDPGRLLPGIVLRVDRVDQGEQPLVGLRALEHPDRVIPELLADAGVIAGRGRDREQQRVAPLAHRGQQHVVDLTGLMGRNLVANRDLHVEPVQRLGVGADRPELRARPLLPDRIRQRLDAVAAADLRRAPHHLAGGVEQDAGLVPRHRGGVALGAALAIEKARDRARAALRYEVLPLPRGT